MRIFAVLLFIVSIGIQSFFIFSTQYGIDSDQAITGLMGKHISEGKFPVFFYGHSFNGSIEAAIAGLLFLTFGVSCHVLKLAPMIFGIIFCISMYYLGREIEDKKTGLFAFIFSLIPPLYLLGHYIAPRTCYIETLVFGNLMFIFLLKAVKDYKVRYIFFLGLFTGLSFWNSPLSVYYILSTLLFIMIKGRSIINVKNIFTGLCGFIIGSLPLWIYNFTHSFNSFRLGYSSSAINIADNLKNLFNFHGQILLVTGIFTKTIFGICIYWFFLLCITFFLLSALCKYRSNYLLLFIFFIVVLAIYVNSQYAIINTQRHLLPLYTFIPIAVAAVCRYLDRFKHTGVFLLIAITGINLYGDISTVETWKPKIIEEDKRFSELMDYLLKNNITRLYAPFWTSYKLSFITNEKITCSEYLNESYDGYEKTIEESDSAAFLNDYHREIEGGLRNIKTKYMQAEIDGKEIIYDITNSSIIGKSVAPKNWKITGNYNMRLARGAIDRNFDKYWIAKKEGNMPPYIEIDLGRLYYIYKVIIFNEHCGENHPAINIYTSRDGRTWDLRTDPKIAAEPIFPSGPRVYYQTWFGRYEFWFSPKNIRYVKVECPTAQDNIQINEIFAYEYKGIQKRNISDYRNCLFDITGFLRIKNINFVYADIWPAAKIREFSNDHIKTLSQINMAYPYRKNTGRELQIDDKKTFLINNEDTDEFEDILNTSGIALVKQPFTYYSLYYSNVPLKSAGSYIWDGIGILQTKVEDNAGRYLAYQPKTRTDVEFANGAKLLGYDIYVSKKLVPGKSIKIEYYWSFDKGIPKDVFVFVYFMKDGKIVFQNDHPIMDQAVKDQVVIKGPVFKEKYLVKVPDSITSGTYEIYLGIWTPKKSKRVYIKNAVSKRKTKAKIGEFDVYSGI